jgi:hypothetical protein
VRQPTALPTSVLTTAIPTLHPTGSPTELPTGLPTTMSPTQIPTATPTGAKTCVLNQEDLDMPGADLISGGITVKSAAECRSQCEAHMQCSVVTFVAQSCYLKTNAAPTSLPRCLFQQGSHRVDPLPTRPFHQQQCPLMNETGHHPSHPPA